MLANLTADVPIARPFWQGFLREFQDTIKGKGSRAPGTEPRDYTVCYWLGEQSEPHRLRLAFDLLNFNPEASATATLYLDNVKLEVLSRR